MVVCDWLVKCPKVKTKEKLICIIEILGKNVLKNAGWRSFCLEREWL